MTESKIIIPPISAEDPEIELFNDTNVKQKRKSDKNERHEINLVQKRRDIRIWKESIGYYYLNPEKFRFGFRDFKK